MLCFDKPFLYNSIIINDVYSYYLIILNNCDISPKEIQNERKVDSKILERLHIHPLTWVFYAVEFGLICIGLFRVIVFSMCFGISFYIFLHDPKVKISLI